MQLDEIVLEDSTHITVRVREDLGVVLYRTYDMVLEHENGETVVTWVKEHYTIPQLLPVCP